MTHFFLDDIRTPKGDWVVARTYREAIDVISKSPKFPVWSLDHDLGSHKSGYDFLVHIALQHPDKLPDRIIVHSSNVVASERIVAMAEWLKIDVSRGKVE